MTERTSPILRLKFYLLFYKIIFDFFKGSAWGFLCLEGNVNAAQRQERNCQNGAGRSRGQDLKHQAGSHNGQYCRDPEEGAAANNGTMLTALWMPQFVPHWSIPCPRA